MSDVPENIREDPLAAGGVLVIQPGLLEGNMDLLKQDGCLHKIVSPEDFEETRDMDAVSFYNWAINSFAVNAVVFLGQGYNFTRSDSLNRMVSSLMADGIYGACYSDNLLYNDSHGIRINKYFSTFGANDQIINTAVCVRGELLADMRFNNDIKLIHLWDLLVKLSQKTLIRHIPEVLVTSPMIMGSIDQDLETIDKG